MAMDLMMGGAPPAGGVPPGGGGADLGALLGAGGQEPQQTSPPSSEVDALDAIMASMEAYLQIPSVDEQERLAIEKCKTAVQQLKAKNQQMVDQVTGASPSLRKALAQ